MEPDNQSPHGQPPHGQPPHGQSPRGRSPQARAHRSRYRRYTGGPDPLAPPIDLRDVLTEMSDDVLGGSSPQAALREYLRRGQPGGAGLDELRRRVLRKRRELLERNNIGKTFAEVQELLDQAVLAERKQLARDLDDDARFAETQLANLPHSAAEAIRELGEYQWRSAEAREKFAEIEALLGRELLEQRFAGMKDALAGATEEDRARITAMLTALNELLAAHNAGVDTDQMFAEFMDEYGDQFPERPESVEELIETLANRSAAAQAMFNSMTPEQQAELSALSQNAFGSPELMSQLDAMDAQLRTARPDLPWDGSGQFTGESGMGWGEAAAAMGDLADLDALAEQLAQQYGGANLDDIDLDALTRQLGAEATVDARTLAAIEREMSRGGLFERDPNGELTLSPKAMRQLGQAIFRDVATGLGNTSGDRMTRQVGAAGEATGATRPWEFGDTEPWEVTRSITNAVLRDAAARGPGLPSTASIAGESAAGTAHPVRLLPEDIEVAETEARGRAAVALLVDVSLSMAWEGRWVPMKRTAIALDHLVRTRFRQDHLQLISFGLIAQPIDMPELIGLQPELGAQGTNLHHGLLLAQKHFRRHPNAQPVLLVVTDGEPTAHLESNGRAHFGYPPEARTLGLTVRQLDAVAAQGTQVTFFRLGDDPSLARFIDTISRRAGGRVVAPDLDGLGAAVVADYLSSRRG